MTVAQRIREAGGAVSFTDFSRIALFDPECGYYRKIAKRVGADDRADFQTNLAVKSVFSPMIIEAAKNLLGKRDLTRFAFIEVGAEPEESLLSGEATEHFRSSEVVRLGDPIPSMKGPAILFANEWLDAQPFMRLVFTGGSWMERFVEVRDDEKLCESLRPPETQAVVNLLPELPDVAPEGYCLDLSVEAESTLRRYLQQDWTGLFLTVDYGSSWEALCTNLPGGTARGYFRHQQVADLLARPGSQDLTANVCWDRLANVLREAGFIAGGPERQEAFFIEHASEKIRQIVEGGDSAQAAECRARLMQLLNPVHFGAAFQVMWGIR